MVVSPIQVFSRVQSVLCFFLRKSSPFCRFREGLAKLFPFFNVHFERWNLRHEERSLLSALKNYPHRHLLAVILPEFPIPTGRFTVPAFEQSCQVAFSRRFPVLSTCSNGISVWCLDPRHTCSCPFVICPPQSSVRAIHCSHRDWCHTGSASLYWSYLSTCSSPFSIDRWRPIWAYSVAFAQWLAPPMHLCRIFFSTTSPGSNP